MLRAVCVGPTRTGTDQSIDCCIDEPVCELVVGSQLRFQEKLGTRFHDTRELRPQPRHEQGDCQSNDAQADQRQGIEFQ
jgi:hypothetical protein